MSGRPKTVIWTDEELDTLMDEYPDKGSAVRIPGKTIEQKKAMAQEIGIKYTGPRKGESLTINRGTAKPRKVWTRKNCDEFATLCNRHFE